MNVQREKPQLFFVGAPRCGTSSMTSYLAQHPEIAISTLKETNYFADDLDLPKPKSEDEYLGLFEVNDGTKVLGEGSILYLYSTTAAERIKVYRPDARILMFLREPVAAAYSWYAQMRFTANEPLETFEAAIAAEDARKAGERSGMAGAAIDCPQLLFYREVYSYHAQVARYLRHFDREQLLILSYDDFTADWRQVYRDVCAFIGVDPDFSPDEKNINAPVERRSWKSHHWLKKHFAAPTRKLLPAEMRFRLINAVDKINSRGADKEKLNPHTRARLAGEFRADLSDLSALLETDFTPWLNGKPVYLGAGQRV